MRYMNKFIYTNISDTLNEGHSASVCHILIYIYIYILQWSVVSKYLSQDLKLELVATKKLMILLFG